MQFRFDQVEEPRPVQRAAGFRIVACTWLGDVQKRGRWEPSPSHVLLAGSGLAAWLSRVVLGWGALPERGTTRFACGHGSVCRRWFSELTGSVGCPVPLGNAAVKNGRLELPWLMFLSDLMKESVWDMPRVLSWPFLRKQKPGVKLGSPSSPAASTACLLWQEVAGVIVYSGFCCCLWRGNSRGRAILGNPQLHVPCHGWWAM